MITKQQSQIVGWEEIKFPQDVSDLPTGEVCRMALEKFDDYCAGLIELM